MINTADLEVINSLKGLLDTLNSSAKLGLIDTTLIKSVNTQLQIIFDNANKIKN